jgi:hypothetical protein
MRTFKITYLDIDDKKLFSSFTHHKDLDGAEKHASLVMDRSIQYDISRFEIYETPIDSHENNN